MKKSLMNKFTLKILSLLIAIFIWLIVMNIENPQRTITLQDVPVTFLNESYIESTSKVPMMVEGKDTVDVRIRAKDSDIKKLSEENVTAVADLTQIINMESDPIMVPVTVVCPGLESETVESSPRNIPITIEAREDQDKIITVNIGDSKPDKNYEIGKLTASPAKVSITGPISIMEKIDSVVAKVDVDGMTESAVKESELTIYDKNQEELTEKQMSYLKFGTPTTVSVQVDLWKIKQDIPISVEYSGTPRYGFQVGSIITTPSQISIAGTDEALQEFENNGNTLVIPPELVNISGKSEDVEEQIDLTEILPENIKLTTDSSESALVTVKILPFGSEEYDIATDSIVARNKPASTDVVYNSDKVSVRVKGSEEDLGSLDISQIKLSIDLKSYTEGEYEVPVKVEVPSGYEVVDGDNVKVKLKIVKAAESTTSFAVITENK